jgi:tetratricopeptide (TPR) repeat protein
MIFQWFNANEAEKIACELADQFAPQAALVAGSTSDASTSDNGSDNAALRDLMRRVEKDGRLCGLNFYKKARFANSFKWRLLEKGIEPATANHVTTSLVVHLSRGGDTIDGQSAETSVDEPGSASETIPDLLRRGNKAFAGEDYSDAVKIFQRVLHRNHTDPEALNGLGAALCKMGKYPDAAQHFRQAVSVAPDYPEASCNLGNVLRWMGILEESEFWLRRALKTKPTYIDARVGLGLTLILLGRTRDAKSRFEKVLKSNPHHADALLGMSQIAKMEGRFSEAEALIRQLLEHNPKMTAAWAVLVTLKKMTPADSDWLRNATELAASGIAPLQEADLRFSIGKYFDDVGEFDKAFRSFEAANNLLKSLALKYDKKGRDELVDQVIRTYTKDLIAGIGEGASPSIKPVFVLGMPRSGTSLTEQILASHPSIKGAGEVQFWTGVVRQRMAEVRAGLLDLPTRKKLAEDYLQLLEKRAGGDALRIIDKTTSNADCIGLILSVFPNARFIYLERDPIDTCLSCYFQHFVAAMTFSTDLSDLAHYYQAHRRLVQHWQSVLPPDQMLVASYEDLVRDQAAWTRKMLDFLGLEWDDKCLSFHETERPVATASTWQVRQKLYSDSVGRWQSYKKHVGPLKALKN